MNASEQAIGLDITTKIAAVVNLFKSEFPDAKADLKPWQNDPDTLSFVDPDSIDIGFHFPGWSRKLQSRSILVQIRLYPDKLDSSFRLIGVETAGFNHQGVAWRLSTIDNWDFIGDFPPATETGDKIRRFCRELFNLFNGLTNS